MDLLVAGSPWGTNMKQAHYNTQTGEILGFYDTEIHEDIPSPTLDLTDEQWQIAISSRHKVVDGELVADPYVPNYIDLRTAEYPDIRDYIDGVVKGDQEQVQRYIDQCLAVKAKYPKPMEVTND